MDDLAELIGDSPGIAGLREDIRRLVARQRDARRLPPILIQGETGTGKGLVARLIHRLGPRASGPFVDINCAAIPETLLEAELFGYERGAFTDARQAKPGLFEAARRGTIFLDEVGLLSGPLQAKLLKIIDERQVRRLGSTRSDPVDVQILSATNDDLAAAVRERRFRPDLYHRLALLVIALPPLRERAGDVIVLAEHFLATTCADYGLPRRALDLDARRVLLGAAWPGNVRQLANVIERAALLSDTGVVTAASLGLSGPEISPSGAASPAAAAEAPAAPERQRLLDTLARTDWNVTRTARHLGLSRSTVRYRIKSHGLLRGGTGPPAVGERPSGPPLVPREPAAGATAPPILRERRRLTLLAMRITGASPAVASRFVETAQEKIRAFDGRVSGLGRTALDGIFGLEPTESAGRRATLAALAIQKAAARELAPGSPGPAVRVAVHAIQALAAVRGDEVDLDEDARRQATAVLQSLLGSAEPGTVVLGDAAATLVDRRFDLEPLTGARSAPAAYRVRGSERTGLGPWGTMGPFVGRRQEGEILRRCWAEAQRGHGQLVALVGEPGVGKSRLAWEAVNERDRHGRHVLRASAVSHGTAISYLPVSDLLRACFEIGPADPPAAVRERVRERLLRLDPSLEPSLPAFYLLLDVPAGDPRWDALDPVVRRRLTLDAVTRALVLESHRQPLLVLVEDLHWVDAATQELLDALVDMLPAASALLLVTYRPGYHHGWAGRSFYTHVRIDPLARGEARDLLQALLGADPSLRLLETTLLDWTGGNPFFIEESVRALVENGVLGGARGSYTLTRPVPSIPVPATVEEVLASRIGHLEAGPRQVLQAAAAIGREVPRAVLAALFPASDEMFPQSLAALQSAELLYQTAVLPEVTYAFRHALTHQVAYDALPPDHRRQLHGQILGVLERRPADRAAELIDRLAHHAREAGAWSKAVGFLHRAGRRAVDRSAYREAVLRFEQALEAIEQLPESEDLLRTAIDLRFDLRRCLAPLGEITRDLEYLRSARSLAERVNDDCRRARLAAYISRDLSILGQPHAALDAAEHALALARTAGDRELEVLVTAYLGSIHYSLGAYRRSVSLLTASLDALAGMPPDRSLGLPGPASVFFRVWLVWSLVRLGEFTQGCGLVDEAVQRAAISEQPLSLVVARYTEGFLALHGGENATAIEVLERTLDLCRHWTLHAWFPNIATALGQAYALAGRTDEAVSLLHEAVTRTSRMQTMVNHSSEVAALGEAHLLAGRPDIARGFALRALELARTHGERGNEAHALALFGQVLEAMGAAEAALVRYREATALAGQLEMRPLLARCQSLALALRGRAGLVEPMIADGRAAHARHPGRPAGVWPADAWP
jgi:transcriptional regulator with AAA-type ATPase domain/tetratricopeptide (TPR) repeat protein